MAPKLPEGCAHAAVAASSAPALVSGVGAGGARGRCRSVPSERSTRAPIANPMPADDPWAGYEVFDRTAAIENFTITSPSDWYLVNQWPLGASARHDVDRDGLGIVRSEHRARRGKLRGHGVRRWEVFASTRRHHAPRPHAAALEQRSRPRHIPLRDRRPPAEGRRRGPGSRDRRAAIDAREAGEASTSPRGPCDSTRAPRTGHVRTRALRPVRGRHLPLRGVRRLRSRRHRGGSPHLVRCVRDDAGVGMDGHRSVARTPAYVIAGGENAAGPWRLELRPSSSDEPTANVELSVVSPEGGAGAGDFTVPGGRPIEQAGGDPVFGAVTKDAAGVEIRLELDVTRSRRHDRAAAAEPTVRLRPVLRLARRRRTADGRAGRRCRRPDREHGRDLARGTAGSCCSRSSGTEGAIMSDRSTGDTRATWCRASTGSSTVVPTRSRSRRSRFLRSEDRSSCSRISTRSAWRHSSWTSMEARRSTGSTVSCDRSAWWASPRGPGRARCGCCSRVSVPTRRPIAWTSRRRRAGLTERS